MLGWGSLLQSCSNSNQESSQMFGFRCHSKASADCSDVFDFNLLLVTVSRYRPWSLALVCLKTFHRISCRILSGSIHLQSRDKAPCRNLSNPYRLSVIGRSCQFAWAHACWYFSNLGERCWVKWSMTCFFLLVLILGSSESLQPYHWLQCHWQVVLDHGALFFYEAKCFDWHQCQFNWCFVSCHHFNCFLNHLIPLLDCWRRCLDLC